MAAKTKPKQAKSTASKRVAIDFHMRNIHFNLDKPIPHVWHPKGKAVTAFFDNLSIFFPPGEAFFISSLKVYRHLAEDNPELLNEVVEFCAQEGIHSREHRRYNQLLEEKGYDVKGMEGRVHTLLKFVRKRLPTRLQLIATTVLEHYTALLAHAILSDDRLMEGADPIMAELWKWHAAEENEHKSVCFDVLELEGKRYHELATVMVLASIIFWAKVFEHQVRMMNTDGILFSVKEWSKLVMFLFVSPGPLRTLTPHFLDFFRPSFHPWDLDNRDLLDAWKVSFAASEHYRR